MQSSSEIPNLLTRADLAAYLGTTLRLLTWWVWAYNVDKRYYEFEIERSSGGAPRVIQAPIKPIKDLQQSLLPMLDGAYTPPPHVHGFARGRGTLTNAALHRGQRWVLRVDLKDFFPTVNFGRVRGVFLAYPFEFPADVATLLAQICCHRNALPQGGPTSPVLSNLVCRSLDKELGAYARVAHCHYTRYADDLCFSSGQRPVPAMLATLVNGKPVLNPDLRAVIESNGFSINETKTRLMPRSRRQRVTGIVVNERINVPREYRRHLRALLYIWEKYGEAEAERAFYRAGFGQNWPPGKSPAEFRLVVRGQLQYLGSVRGYDRVYQELAATLAELDSSFGPSAPTVPTVGLVIFAGEGPSDGLHIQAALRAFRKLSVFSQLEFRPVEHQTPKNDEQLWKWLIREKDVPHPAVRLGLFDCDSSYGAQLGSSGWRHFGHGVIGVALSRPTWLSASEPFCIEMLHRPATLRRVDTEGRRVWLRREFDAAGRSFDGRFKMRYPQQKTLVVTDVESLGERKESVALGKYAFANAIWRGEAPYEHVDFDGFRPTLDRIWRAVASGQRWCA